MTVRGAGEGSRMPGRDTYTHACYKCRGSRTPKRSEKRSIKAKAKRFWRKDQQDD